MMNLGEPKNNIKTGLNPQITKEKQIFCLYKHSEPPTDNLNIKYSENVHKKSHRLEDNEIGKIISETSLNTKAPTNTTYSQPDLKDTYSEGPYLNYYSLPKFGISESSTQTDLTFNDIEELMFMREERLKNSDAYLKKQAVNCNLNLKTSNCPVKHFIGIKRKGEPFKFKTRVIKHNAAIQRKPRKPRKTQQEGTAAQQPVNVSNVTETNNYIMFNEFLIDKKTPKILFDEGFNVADMINDIKLNKISMFSDAKKKNVSIF
jgi:hypothetical protein